MHALLRRIQIEKNSRGRNWVLIVVVIYIIVDVGPIPPGDGEGIPFSDFGHEYDGLEK
jgi:hypothetical protein